MGRVTSWLQDAAIKIGPILPSPMTSSMRDFGVSRSGVATGCEVLRRGAAAE